MFLFGYFEAKMVHEFICARILSIGKNLIAHMGYVVYTSPLLRENLYEQYIHMTYRPPYFKRIEYVIDTT